MKIYHSIFISTLLIIFLIPNQVTAQSCGDSSQCSDPNTSLECITNLTLHCQALLDIEQQRDKTLQSQLNLIDTRTKLTQLKMDETNAKIAKLEKEIDYLSTRITYLTASLNSVSKLLINKVVQTYKYGDYSAIDLFFSSNGFADLLEKVKYAQAAQVNDKKVLYQLQTTRATYNNQKTERESRQIQEKKLKKDLLTYQTQLEEQKKAKDELLRITKNNEANYQTLIKRLEADRKAILRAISDLGAVVGEVSRGQIIAHEGNTGCVEPPPPGGYHLHFEVYKNAKVKDGKIVDNGSGESVQSKISNYLVNPRPYLDNDQFSKPIPGFPNNISAEFGYVKNYLLNGGFHTGLDIADPAGSPIYAVESGTAYAAGGPICDQEMNYPPGTTLPARGRVIDHHNGFVTLYWHIL